MTCHVDFSNPILILYMRVCLLLFFFLHVFVKVVGVVWVWNFAVFCQEHLYLIVLHHFLNMNHFLLKILLTFESREFVVCAFFNMMCPFYYNFKKFTVLFKTKRTI